MDDHGSRTDLLEILREETKNASMNQRTIELIYEELVKIKALQEKLDAAVREQGELEEQVKVLREQMGEKPDHLLRGAAARQVARRRERSTACHRDVCAARRRVVHRRRAGNEVEDRFGSLDGASYGDVLVPCTEVAIEPAHG